MIYILILTIIGSSSQSGHTIHSVEFAGFQACDEARKAWLASYPRTPDNKYYDEGTPRAICVPKGN